LAKLAELDATGAGSAVRAAAMQDHDTLAEAAVAAASADADAASKSALTAEMVRQADQVTRLDAGEGGVDAKSELARLRTEHAHRSAELKLDLDAAGREKKKGTPGPPGQAPQTGRRSLRGRASLWRRSRRNARRRRC
jgi:hypothetical protein